jgi:hypothetical protein
VAGTVGSAFGAATSNIAKATDQASLAVQSAFDEAINQWSETRLKAYLDARGIVRANPHVLRALVRAPPLLTPFCSPIKPVPHASKTDELRAMVRKHSHKAASGWTSWTFDDFSVENLKSYLSSSSDAAAKQVSENAGATREELVKAAQSAYASASLAGGDSFASVTSYLAQATDSVKSSAFDAWSESDLKSYLDSYGIVSFPIETCLLSIPSAPLPPCKL